jgi:beta-lactam-binding protein with PASTA domain
MKAITGLAISALAAFVTGLVLFQLGMLAFVRSGSETRVPDLVGLDVVAARSALESAGFTGVAETEVYSAEFGEGVVVEQRPAKGRVLRKGRKVWLTVSRGLRKAAVPGLAGLSYRQAGIVLAQDKLVAGAVSRVHHPDVRRGAVIAQDPPAGAALAEGGHVDLLVSLGPPPEAYVMPDLSGRPLREVESLLERHGLHLGDKTVLIDRAVLPGTVLEHEPGPGRRISAGDGVDLVVSSRR